MWRIVYQRALASGALAKSAGCESKGGADASEGCEGAQRQLMVFPRPNVFTGWGK